VWESVTGLFSSIEYIAALLKEHIWQGQGLCFSGCVIDQGKAIAFKLLHPVEGFGEVCDKRSAGDVMAPGEVAFIYA
jgi:hypothetical protein